MNTPTTCGCSTTLLTVPLNKLVLHDRSFSHSTCSACLSKIIPFPIEDGIRRCNTMKATDLRRRQRLEEEAAEAEAAMVERDANDDDHRPSSARRRRRARTVSEGTGTDRTRTRGGSASSGVSHVPVRNPRSPFGRGQGGGVGGGGRGFRPSRPSSAASASPRMTGRQTPQRPSQRPSQRQSPQRPMTATNAARTMMGRREGRPRCNSSPVPRSNDTDDTDGDGAAAYNFGADANTQIARSYSSRSGRKGPGLSVGEIDRLSSLSSSFLLNQTGLEGDRSSRGTRTTHATSKLSAARKPPSPSSPSSPYSSRRSGKGGGGRQLSGERQAMSRGGARFESSGRSLQSDAEMLDSAARLHSSMMRRAQELYQKSRSLCADEGRGKGRRVRAWTAPDGVPGMRRKMQTAHDDTEYA